MVNKDKKKEEEKTSKNTDCLKGLILPNNDMHKTTPVEMMLDSIMQTTDHVLDKMFGINLKYYPIKYNRGDIDKIIKNDPCVLSYIYEKDKISFKHLIDPLPEATYMMHDELLTLLIYAYFDFNNISIISGYIQLIMIYNIIPAYIFKLWTINGLPESQAEIFDTCQQMIIDDDLLYNDDYKTSFALRSKVLFNVFHDEKYIEKLDKIYPDYRSNLINYYIDMMEEGIKTPIPMMLKTDETLTNFYSHLSFIKDRESVDEARNAIDKEILTELAVERLTLLCDLLYELFDIFDKVMDEACKKYPEIADNIKNLVTVEARSNLGIINSMTSQQIQSFDESFVDLIDDHSIVFQTMVSTAMNYSRFKGGSSPIVFNIDQIIGLLVVDLNRMTYDQIINDFIVAMRHEFGHAIAHIFEILKYDDEDFLFAAIDHSNRIKKLEMQRREDNPNIAKIHHTVWYYSYLPEERKANKYMDLTIEDLLIADGEEITPEIRADIDSINIEQIMIEEQKMLLEL